MTTSQQATRAAIVAAVRAFVERVEDRTRDASVFSLGWAFKSAMRAELAALERTVAADAGEGEEWG